MLEISMTRKSQSKNQWMQVAAVAALAEQLLGWKAQRGLREMCEDSWRWQKNNPDGYGD